ncbi:hypothetical protein MVES_001655 [Malassezia vespertilionis]|uniref:Ubinuclein middle domain-containing protein n=1 Tax=Malassezia vespertilionis TaxID=2020962 RepID=A0A2N1JD58_9BASI|nr:hypothetical protein MVES_001655 [Malassezia vespertilionis]
MLDKNDGPSEPCTEVISLNSPTPNAPILRETVEASRDVGSQAHGGPPMQVSATQEEGNKQRTDPTVQKIEEHDAQNAGAVLKSAHDAASANSSTGTAARSEDEPKTASLAENTEAGNMPKDAPIAMDKTDDVQKDALANEPCAMEQDTDGTQKDSPWATGPTTEDSPEKSAASSTSAPDPAAKTLTSTRDPDKSLSGSDEESDADPTNSKKRARSPESDDEPDHDNPPPRPTIRLRIDLSSGKGKNPYIYSIPKLSVRRMKDKYPKWAAWFSATYLEEDTGNSGYQNVGLSQQELNDLGGLAKLLQKYPSRGAAAQPQKKRRSDEYDVGSYDTKDPFVDDSELGVDEPTHIVKTRSDGFYVACGPVELARGKTSKPSSFSSSGFQSNAGGGHARHTNKLLAKRAALRVREDAETKESSTTLSTAAAEYAPPNPSPSKTVDPAPSPAIVPYAAPTSTTDTAAPESASTTPADKAEKKKNKYPIQPVHPDLQKRFDHLKTLVQRASFAVKTKFPPELKPPLIETAKLAVELDEYNENFFNYLPSIFPYNRFTMMKLTKREFFHKHMEYYRELQEEHMDILYKLVQTSFPEQKAEYEASNEEARAQGKEHAPPEDDTGDVSAEGHTDELAKRFRWTEEMRDELFTIVTVENGMSEIRNEKLQLENSGETYSEINARKTLYKRIADFIPEEGWMNTTMISREYGIAKKRYDRLDPMEDDI